MNRTAWTIMAILCLSVTACKDIGLDDEVLNALDCIAGADCDDASDATGSELGIACYFYCDGDYDCGVRPKCKGGEDEYGIPITANYCGQNNGVYGQNDEPFICDDDSYDTGSSTGTSSGGSTSSSSSSGSTTTTSGTASSAADPSDSSGGIAALPAGSKGSSRYFMGTYELNDLYNYDGCTYEYWGNSYDFPGVVRAYSYGNKLDFEDNSGNLVWNAEIFPDDTFDFSVQFLDSFGRPSNTVACTCYIEEPYSYTYDTDTIKCTCDPSYEEDDVCSLTYDMM